MDTAVEGKQEKLLVLLYGLRKDETTKHKKDVCNEEIEGSRLISH